MVSETIGTLREKSLHNALKTWLARPGDQVEAEVDGYRVDIRRGDLLIEIQTANFSAIRRKLERLLEHYPLRLVYPLAVERWVVRVDLEGRQLARRKSPWRGRVEEVFTELVRIPGAASRPGFSLEVLLIREERVLRQDGLGSWRRAGWSLFDRRLLEVVGSRDFHSPADYGALLPGVGGPFSNRELAAALACRLSLAQKMTYTLVKMGVLAAAGKRGRAALFRIDDSAPAG
jgi:hypothetical protein